jgi:integrase
MDLLDQQWQEHLERYPDCPYVFHRSGNPIISYAKDWRKAVTEAGLVGKIPHDFRRTAVRNLVRAGVPERVAMAITGHKTRSVFERYNIVSDGDLKDAAQKLERAFTPQTTTLSTTLPDALPAKSLN